MIGSWVLNGASASFVAAGIYSLVKRKMPPLLRDENGERYAPELDARSTIRWGIAFVVFGVLLAALTAFAATLQP